MEVIGGFLFRCVTVAAADFKVVGAGAGVVIGGALSVVTEVKCSPHGWQTVVEWVEEHLWQIGRAVGSCCLGAWRWLHPLQKKDLPVGWKLSVVFRIGVVSVLMVVVVDVVGSGCWVVEGAMVVDKVVVGFCCFVLLAVELPMRSLM